MPYMAPDLAALDAIQGARVLVVGDAMLDRFVFGQAERLSPEAPVPVFRPRRREETLGGAGNVAANLKALGCEPVLVCALGLDEAAESFRRLADFEILAAGRESDVTTVKERLIADGQHVLRIDREQRDDIRWADVSPFIRDALPEVSGVVISDYGKGVIGEETAAGVIRLAKDHDLPVVVDPAARRSWPYRGADVLTPNRQELALAWGDGPEAVTALGLNHLVVTRGAEGLSLFGPDGETECPTEAAAISDGVGAGDTVTAVIGAFLAAGLDMDSACRLANKAAGLAVRKPGTVAIRVADLKFAAAQSKFEPVDRLGELAGRWRAAGLRIGFTNGVFDLLHPGHLHLLRQAKAVCDRLIVALNDDGSAADCKRGRPVQNLASRLAVVAGLDCVDVVTSFDGPSPEPLVELCRPDVLVKGGDYREEDVAGRAFAGRVLIVPVLAGHSTTQTVVKARRAAA